MTIRRFATKYTKTRRRIAETVIETCCHRIKVWYEIGWSRMTGENLQALEEEAEQRATQMIGKGYHSGTLCCLSLTPVRLQEREFHGWWSIE